ncbi:MAG: SDR family oxidoreductase [Pseudomonadota bacterium]
MSDLTGKVALITGASRGIGLATAGKLSTLGVSVVLAARTVSEIEKHADAIEKQGGKALAIRCDVTAYGDVQRVVDRTVEAFGALDILVNNAGLIDPITQLATSDPEAWGLAVDINLKGVYHGLRAAIPVMETQKQGIIINMSSGAANSALEGWSHYCATKAAAKKLTECAHKEMGDRGIRVVGLSPGTVATDMMSRVASSGINPVSQLNWSSHIPPEWAAEAVAFLCGPGGVEFAGMDFSIKTEEGRRLVGLPAA